MKVDATGARAVHTWFPLAAVVKSSLTTTLSGRSPLWHRGLRISAAPQVSAHLRVGALDGQVTALAIAGDKPTRRE
jgi:hypothetical protein